MCSRKHSKSLQRSPNIKKNHPRTGNRVLLEVNLKLANLKESAKPCNSEVDFDFDGEPVPVGLAVAAAP